MVDPPALEDDDDDEEEDGDGFASRGPFVGLHIRHSPTVCARCFLRMLMDSLVVACFFFFFEYEAAVRMPFVGSNGVREVCYYFPSGKRMRRRPSLTSTSFFDYSFDGWEFRMLRSRPYRYAFRVSRFFVRFRGTRRNRSEGWIELRACLSRRSSAFLTSCSVCFRRCEHFRVKILVCRRIDTLLLSPQRIQKAPGWSIYGNKNLR